MAKAKTKADPLAKRADETFLAWRSRVAAANQNDRDKSEPIVPVEARQHGTYRQGPVMHIETNTRAETYRLIELPSVVEQWHKKGVIGFEMPAMDAMRRCIALWEARPLIGNMAGNYEPTISAGSTDHDRHIISAMDDTAEIERYARMFHPAHWYVFEAVVRYNRPLAEAGMEQGNGPQSTSSARAIVGTVANFIAMQMRC